MHQWLSSRLLSLSLSFVEHPSSYMIVQGIGIQQHSKSPQSMHFVLPGSMPAGLRIDEAAEEVDGREKLTKDEDDEVGVFSVREEEHILILFLISEVGF